MNGGYILFRGDLADKIFEHMYTETSFEYVGAYDYIYSIIITNKPIIFFSNSKVGSVEINYYDIISFSISGDSVIINARLRRDVYEITVTKNSNNVTVVKLGGGT